MSIPIFRIKKSICFFRVLIFSVLLSSLFLFSLGRAKKSKKESKFEVYNQYIARYKKRMPVYKKKKPLPFSNWMPFFNWMPASKNKCYPPVGCNRMLPMTVFWKEFTDLENSCKTNDELYTLVESEYQKYCRGDDKYTEAHTYAMSFFTIVKDHYGFITVNDGTNFCYFKNGKYYSEKDLYERSMKRKTPFKWYNKYVFEYKKKVEDSGEGIAIAWIMNQGIYQKMENCARTNQLFYTFVESQFKKYYAGDSAYKKEHAYDRFLDLIVGKHLGLNFGTYPKDEKIHFRKRTYSRDYIYSKLKEKEDGKNE